jgi:FdhE protein
VDAIRRRRPEWSPWLAVIEDVQREAATSRWDAAVPVPASGRAPAQPLLSGAVIDVDASAVRRLLLRLVEIASRGGTPKMASLRPALRGQVDAAALFRASLCHDKAHIAAIAETSSADPDALQAIVALVAVPLLHACQRAWKASIPIDWMEGYCPVCGSWPAFAETRGIERTRSLRCGRCGVDWHAPILRCVYCGNRDHDHLTTLVSDQAGAAGIVEACRRCSRYAKAFTRLQGCAPAEVMLDDLASVDLDVAAIQHGYTRPQGAGCAVDVDVRASASARRVFTWNA